MSDATPILSLPLILPAQAQKHVTHNEALRQLDIVVQLSVLDRVRTTPPAGPAEGDRYLVAGPAAGAWAGRENRIAAFWGGVWVFVEPAEGWTAWIAVEDRTVVFDGSTWSDGSDRPLAVARLGVAAVADDTSRLAVAAAASLFTNAGAGHQLKINKVADSDTASVLFQTGWSGRAEMGTTGSDDFAIKVSADGASWNTALLVERASGRARLPGGVRLPDGSAAVPALAFDSSADTGLFRAAAGQIGLAAGGTARAILKASEFQIDVPVKGTAVTQTATDTTAGRLMKNGDHGVGTTSPRASGNILPDWLATNTPTGFHSLGGDAETTNKPTGLAGAGWGGEMTVRVSDVLGARFGWRAFRNATEFFMQKWDGGGWGDLLKFLNNRNIVGTVVNSSGVPDGAVIEKGSNANGHYTRWADGTQACWRSMAASSGAATTWTFPAAFSAAPVVSGTAEATVLSAVCLDSAPTATAASFSARDKADARRADTCHLRATGRWF